MNTKSFEELEADRFQWSLKTFTEATDESSLIKAADELYEVTKELIAFKKGQTATLEALAEEYADVIMCLFDSAGRAGIRIMDLRDAFAKKLEKNKAREWVKNNNNTYSHVKEASNG